MFPKIPIKFIFTGGTIDSSYHQSQGKMLISANVEKILSSLRLPNHQIIWKRLFKIDSREMTSDHRNQIVSEIKNSKEKRLIITHGTDTMIETGCFLISTLGKYIKSNNKTVVLTGAMVPYGVEKSLPRSKKSDAEHNVVSAIAMVEVLSSGVWIVFHGRKINPRNAYKDYKQLTILEKR